jgi:hypothetical protein
MIIYDGSVLNMDSACNAFEEEIKGSKERTQR